MTLYDLYSFAEARGVEVEYFPMREVVSASFPQGWIAMDVDKLRDSTEEKTVLAHELGHCETGSFYNVFSPLDLRAKHEARANRWAIKKLLPFEELRGAMQAGFTTRYELAEYFSVTEDFVQMALDYYAGPCGLRFE